MRKFIITTNLFLVVLVCLCSGCSKQESSQSVADSPKIIVTETELNTKIHSICKLATIEVFYHNVGKTDVYAGDGIEHLGEKDRKYWVEYTGSAKLGIDASKISAKIDGENITITIPKAEILNEPEWNSKNVETFVTPDSFNSNKLSSTIKDTTIETAQSEMKTEILKNNQLCVQAEDNAKQIIESFVNKMSELNGIQYNIIWKELE